MRTTDFCHLNNLRAPVPRAFPARSTAFTVGTSCGVLGSARLDRGTECFTTLVNASADRTEPALPVPLHHSPLPAENRSERGRFLPTALTTIEPLTPLSRHFFRGSRRRLRVFSFVLTEHDVFRGEGAAEAAVSTAS